MDDFIIEGHRGVQSLYPENTLASFQAAIDLKLQFVELDLHCTKDGEIVIHHDFDVRDRLISTMTLEEVKKIDVGEANPDFPLQRAVPRAQIPTLTELFEMAHKTNLCFNLEIKSDPRHPEYTQVKILAKKVTEIVRKYGFEKRVYYSSFDPAALEAIRENESSATLAFLYYEGLPRGPIAEPLIQICKKLHCKIVSPHASIIDQKMVDAFKNAGLQVIPWTVNEESTYQELVSMGVNGVISDYPQRFL